MKMVIDIDKKAFDYIMACSFVENEAVVLNQSLEDRIKTLMFFDVLNAIKNGTPLPEHKGRLMLVDIDELPFFRCPNNVNKCPPYYDFTCQHCDYGITSRFRIERMGTLIEPKKEKENE